MQAASENMKNKKKVDCAQQNKAEWYKTQAIIHKASWFFRGRMVDSAWTHEKPYCVGFQLGEEN